MTNTLVGFDERTARKLVDMVREDTAPATPFTPSPECYLRENDVVKITTEVTARSGATAGTGVGQSVYLTDHTSNPQPIEYTLVNWYASTIAVDTYVIIIRHRQGDWLVVGADCP